jgi:hypothetical protein
MDTVGSSGSCALTHPHTRAISDLVSLVGLYPRGLEEVVEESDVVTLLVERLTVDETLLNSVRRDPCVALSNLVLPSALQRATAASRSATLRALSSPDEELGWLGQGRPSVGPQCTQAGCHTHGNCPSTYACSGAPPRC